MAQRFWLGEEQMLEHEHVGKVVYVNHYSRSKSRIVGGVTQAYAWHLFVHVGTLVGFVESRGKVALPEGKRPDDLSEFPDVAVRAILDDGRSITIEEEDRCLLWFPEED